MIPTISTIPIAELASGDILSIQVYKFVGAKPGKKAYLQANLHGAEIVGNAVIAQLIEFLKTLDDTQLAGEIWLVPTCNPLGTNQRSHHFSSGRYNHYDGKDWNRIFWDYEKEGEDIAEFAKTQLDLEPSQIRQNYRQKIKNCFDRAIEKIDKPSSVSFSDRYRYHLQGLCLDADYVLDLHSSTNQSIDYLYCFQGQEESARYFLLDASILFNEYDGNAFDEAFLKSWLALESEFEKLDRTLKLDVESWTIELGSGMQIDPDSVFRGVRGIKNYLAYKQILDISGFPLYQSFSQKVEFTPKSRVKGYYSSRGGMIRSRVDLGTCIQTGQLLYQILCFNKKGRLPEIIDVRAEASGRVFQVSTNHAVNEGEYVLGVMELSDK
ncbi:succinylglutamate desuccinylase/aspartoacylase family protein [Oscillatoriales cyanobacterium LEGE 11467]|uniref:Succinylglutamate desuccinylase/aspartoacylase family protein n=1 Tax=Zarconia navalis LEGE 11467 TaxID=1828826 RepID=A0A928VYT3_9CYAN|nr:succinylglutamate desuccinylase/aspartoacylase family protein [Zarconia navalis]MBE9042119.1 succinylglutamate desuccinylase/aspartoacylase family protein [Zarconia navalis LEGE 11467]